MAIDPSLLISAPVLQDYLVDKTTGGPLSGGILTFYQDNSRTTLKNVYYQSGSPGSYTYIALPNPLTLSDVGTIEDANGNDVIPFFYPYSETDASIKQPYYITVFSAQGQLQFTRQNFPFNPSSTSPTAVNATNDNLIANNEFWRNIGTLNATPGAPLTNTFVLNGNTLYYATIAPSQHDGFTTMSDIQYFKNTNDATDVLTFKKFVGTFTDQIIPDDITPEFYLNINCTGIGTENTKYVQVPIQLHVDALSGVTTCCVVIDAMAVTGNPSITLTIFQFLGTGVTSVIPLPTATIPLTNDWNSYSIPFTMPTAQGLTLGNGGDDALYLQIGFPTGAIFNINISKPAIYLALTPPTNDWQTYDEVNSIICAPRTGDVRTSMNTFYPYGWVPMNGGTIGYNSNLSAAYLPTARNNVDTWPLFNLLWNAFKAYTTSTTNLLAQMVNSSAVNVAYGSSAIADFSANNAITLTKSIGQVILGTVPVSALLNTYTTTFTVVNSGGMALQAPNTINGFNGMPFYVSAGTGGVLPPGLSANTIYYVANFSPNIFNVSTSFANAMAGVVMPYNSNVGTPPYSFTFALAGTFEGEYSHTQLLAELAAHTHTITPYTAAGPSPPGTVAAGSSTPQGPLAVTGSTGSNVPFNVTQPGTFYNIFMKL